MKSTRLINRKKQYDQISIEMLILWTLLAGVLAAMIPPFTQAMDAHQTITHIHALETFSTQLEEGIERITYAGPGSQLTLHVPTIEKMEMEIYSDQIILSYTHPSLSRPKEYSIQSILPLNGTASPGKDIRMVREEDSITIQ